MAVSVVLKDGMDCSVDKNELQFLLATRQILFFERSNGWVVVGRDEMRCRNGPLAGKDRRQPDQWAKKFWY